jgi:site-specific recombinase XerC
VRFAGYLEAEGDPATLADVTLANARAFVAHLQGKTSRYADHDFRPEQAGGLSPRTIHAYVRTLKTFGNWLHEEGFVAASGIPWLHAHLCRHTFAVRYLMNGGDVMTLRLILGHTSLDVTQLYLHLAETHVQVQHSRFSPMDRLVRNRGSSA